MSSPEQFSKRMGEIAKNIERNTERAVRKVANEIGTVLVVATPVDTGRARSNWLAAVNGTDVATVEATGEGETIANIARRVRSFKVGGYVTISNSLPYIEALDKGSSRQAPGGMTAQALHYGRIVAKQQKLLVNFKVGDDG